MISKQIKQRIKDAGGKFWAGDNISEYILDGEKEQLVKELTGKFEDVLDSLIIDREMILTAWKPADVLLKCM